MFEELKNSIKIIIKKNERREINSNTNNKNIGIYMIYIDNFNDDKIIPIYIGQTGCGKNRNFQTRYEEHMKEVMALNRLKYDYYKEVLLSSFYEGHYKTCKIFQYMVDHGCTLKDFHMIVLEEIGTEIGNLQELLDKKEQEYFSKYLPAFFGFNQINTVIEKVKEPNVNLKKSNKLLKYELEDCENFIKYFGFGYTKFNYYHCFSKTHNVEDNDKKISYEIKEKKELLKSKYYDENKFKEYKDKLLKLDKQREKIVENIQNYKNKFDQIYAPKIKEYCNENKIRITQKYEDIVKMLTWQNEDSIINFEKYLKKKKIKLNILDVLNRSKEFTNWREGYIECIENRKNLNYKINECKNIERIDDLLRILPEKKYDWLPLKDRYQEIEFKDLEDNSIIINFEFSNNGHEKEWDSSYNLIKMDYKLNKNNKIIENKNIFIKSQEDYEKCNVRYYEKDLGNPYKLHKVPFCVINVPDYISTAMEVQNGINDFTIMNKKKVNLKKVLDEINLLINENTKVKIEVRNKMKKKCKEFIEYNYKSENLLKKKILELK